jgi:hypothetical protein
MMTEKQASPVLTVDTFGHPGTRHYVGMAGPMRTTKTPDERKSDTAPRPFVAKALFTKAPVADTIIDCTPQAGSSYILLAPPPPRQPTFTTILGVIRLFLNEANELSMAEMTLQASTLQEARDTFCAALYPALDFLSFEHDVPIFVSTMRFDDPQNAIMHMGYLAPYENKKPSIENYLYRPEVKAVYALYREAKTSFSSPYKLLSYFKILEGLLGPERRRIRQEALAKGVKLTERPDVVPPHDDYPAEATAYIGKSFTKFRDDVLEKKYRDVVAHFFLSNKGKSGSQPLDLSVPFEVWRLEDMVLPAELCARVVIETHLIWADQLK